MRPFSNYYTAVFRKGFSTKFLLEAKMPNIAFWNISYLVVLYSSVALHFTFDSKQTFAIIKPA